MKAQRLLASFAAVSLAAAGTVPSSTAAAIAAMPNIGVAAAVKGLVKAMPASAPESVGRVLQSGKPLYLNEHVTTGPGGHLQIMLRDETVFTMGPNSDIVLDEFVYNPATEAGKISASVTKGVFRFITGNIGKKDPSQMEVKLPAGTIGIRGTIVAGRVNTNGTSMAVLLGPGPAASGARVGAFNLSNSAGSVFVEKPGFGSTLQGAGAPPTQPTLIPVVQMRSLLSDLAPKTAAQHTEEGKQMLAERFAQKMAAARNGEEKGEGRHEGDREMTAAEREIAAKMMAGEPLSPEEQAQARQGMDVGNMSDMEKAIAEKMMAGSSLTPEQQQQLGMMMAGEQMLERMDPQAMTPEQRQFAEKMMAGDMSPEQQQQMMSRMSPEQQAMMAEMSSPMGPYHFDGGDPTALMGGYPMGESFMYSGGELGPYGGIDTYLGTPEFFNSFYDPSLDPSFYKIPPGTADVPNGPTTWENIRSQVVTGIGTFPGQSGAFMLNTCNGSACVGAAGSWGFSDITADFSKKTISGTAFLSGVSAGGVSPINDTKPFGENFSALTGNAEINVVSPTVTSGAGTANYHFQIGNGGGIPAGVLSGNANYDDTAASTFGVGEPLAAIMVGP